MELVLFEYVKDHLPKGFDPYYIYSMVVDGEEVGRITLREGNDEARYYDGHVGYTVFEEYRGHNYSYEGCLLLKKIVNKDHLILTCSPRNIASQKIIKKLGCQYLETKVIPQRLKKILGEDEEEKMVFCWDIKEKR